MIRASIEDSWLAMFECAAGGWALGEAVDEAGDVGAMIMSVKGEVVIGASEGAPERETFLIQFGMCLGAGPSFGLSLRLRWSELRKTTREGVWSKLAMVLVVDSLGRDILNNVQWTFREDDAKI